MGAFFYDDADRSKLLVLYFVNSLNIDLTRDQIAYFSTVHDLMPYFDLQTTVGELEADGYLAAVPRPYGHAFLLTDMGRETLAMFKNRIPAPVQDTLDKYADECRDDMLRQTQSLSTFELAGPDGSYTVNFKVIEDNRTLLGLELLLPDSGSVNRSLSRWKEKSTDIYQYIIKQLAEE